MSFDYQKSIDFLLENGRDVIQYRLHKDILHDLTEAEEELLLEKVMQTPEYQLLLTHVKPNGYIGIGILGWWFPLCRGRNNKFAGSQSNP